MKKICILTVLLLATTSMFAADAADNVRRTVIVRDGNVVWDESDPPGKRAFLGISMVELTPELRDFFGAPREAGVLVSSVSENGPAAKAGVRVGDVITAVNGKPIAGLHDVRAAIRDNHAGDAVRIEVLRAKSRQTLVATAEEREMPEIRAFNLKELGPDFPAMPQGVWKQRMIGPGDNEELRKQIRDLEKRLQDLEKRLQK
jgi:C-terminal processing protease CtpA/Prc